MITAAIGRILCARLKDIDIGAVRRSEGEGRDGGENGLCGQMVDFIRGPVTPAEQAAKHIWADCNRTLMISSRFACYLPLGSVKQG